MKTEALILELARRAAPVRPLAHPLARFSWWLGAAVASVALGAMAIGIRADLASVGSQPAFVLHTSTVVALAAVSAMAAFHSSVPGTRSHSARMLPALALACWSIVLAWSAASEGELAAGPGVRCIRNILVLSLPAGVLMHVMLRRAAPLARGAVGLMSTLSVAALAHAGTRFICPNDGALHVATWHLSTVLVLAAAGIVLGRWSFR